jgi:hypothetical protein
VKSQDKGGLQQNSTASENAQPVDGVLSGQEAFAQAKAAAAKALALDDSLGEAHASLALALDLYGWE